MKRLRGVISALLTASNEDGSFNEAGMRENIENSIKNGISGLFVFGSAGEFLAYTPEEKSAILDVVVDQTAGRIPIIAGCGAATTREALKLCQVAEGKRVDYVSVVTPFYLAPTQEDLYEHYRILAERCSLPIILYNIPPRTGLRIEPEIVGRLKKLDNIVGIKDSSGDLELFKRYMEYDSEDFRVMMGIDALFLTAFQLGATAAVSAPANALAKNQVGIYNSFMAGDLEEAERLQKRFLHFKELIALAPGPTIAKEAANIVGVPVGPPCGPLRRPTGEIWERLNRVLHEEFADCFVK